LECAALSALWLVAAWRDLIRLELAFGLLGCDPPAAQSRRIQSADKAAHSKAFITI
jgi:hypothetical protein